MEFAEMNKTEKSRKLELWKRLGVISRLVKALKKANFLWVISWTIGHRNTKVKSTSISGQTLDNKPTLQRVQYENFFDPETSCDPRKHSLILRTELPVFREAHFVLIMNFSSQTLCFPFPVAWCLTDWTAKHVGLKCCTIFRNSSTFRGWKNSFIIDVIFICLHSCHCNKTHQSSKKR